MIVLDASIVIKWFQEEEDSAKARGFETKHIGGEEIIAVPDLLLYEFTNVLRYRKDLEKENIFGALDILAKMELQIFVFSAHELKEAFQFAREHDISVYDAVYAVLAKRLNCRFVTADKKLKQKLDSCDWVFLLQ